MAWPNPPLDVVETDRFTAQAVALAGSIERWDEIKETLDLDLARNPTIFPEIPNTELHAVTLSTIPPRTIYFKIDVQAGVITLEAIL